MDHLEKTYEFLLKLKG